MKVKIQQRVTRNSIGGISLIDGLLNSLKILKNVDLMRMNKVKTGKIKHSGILKTIAGLFGIGKNDYADVTPFHDDAFFRDCLKLPAVPSEETLRQRIDELVQAQEIPGIIKFSNVEMLKKVSYLGTEKTTHNEYIPLDIDVSPLDNSGSNKEGVSWTYKNHDGYAPVFATFEVEERTIDKHGQDLLIPDVEVNTFWTNLPDDAATVINLYHAHGTSEQYHSEMKSDLSFERMPSGKFATNALLLLLAMLAFNALRLLGQSVLKMKEALPRKFNVKRRCLRSVLQDLIYIACKRTRHSGTIFLKFGRYCPWFEVFRQLHIKFC